MTWIVKAGDWYLNEDCWYTGQHMGERFQNREHARHRRDYMRMVEGFEDARIVKLLPKAPRFWIRFVGTGMFVKQIFRGGSDPAATGTVCPSVEGALFDREMADGFVGEWNAIARTSHTFGNLLEVVPCSTL